MSTRAQVIEQRTRPSPWQWLRYTFGAGLPPELREWVVKDTTGRTWVWRQVLRCLIYVSAPAVLVMLFMPSALVIRAGATIGGIVMGTFYGLVYMVETTEHRLAKAGFPPGTGEHLRRARAYGEDYTPES